MYKSKFIIHNTKQICSPAGMECMRKRASSSCGVACKGLYADVNKRQMNVLLKLILRSSPREVTTEKQQNDLGKLMLMRQEYERYKDLWGTNLHYSHSAGPTKNYSELMLKT